MRKAGEPVIFRVAVPPKLGGWTGNNCINYVSMITFLEQPVHSQLLLELIQVGTMPITLYGSEEEN
jgi:hypothetical protein